MIFALLLACDPPRCGSADRPYTDLTCPCVTFASAVPSAGWGTAGCRPDQTGTLVSPPDVQMAGRDVRAASVPTLFCTCRE